MPSNADRRRDVERIIKDQLKSSDFVLVDQYGKPISSPRREDEEAFIRAVAIFTANAIDALPTGKIPASETSLREVLAAALNRSNKESGDETRAVQKTSGEDDAPEISIPEGELEVIVGRIGKLKVKAGISILALAEAIGSLVRDPLAKPSTTSEHKRRSTEQDHGQDNDSHRILLRKLKLGESIDLEAHLNDEFLHWLKDVLPDCTDARVSRNSCFEVFNVRSPVSPSDVTLEFRRIFGDFKRFRVEPTDVTSRAPWTGTSLELAFPNSWKSALQTFAKRLDFEMTGPYSGLQMAYIHPERVKTLFGLNGGNKNYPRPEVVAVEIRTNGIWMLDDDRVSLDLIELPPSNETQ